MFITKCGGKCIPLVKGKYFNFFKTRNKKHALNLLLLFPFFKMSTTSPMSTVHELHTHGWGQREKQCYLGFK